MKKGKFSQSRRSRFQNAESDLDLEFLLNADPEPTAVIPEISISAESSTPSDTSIPLLSDEDFSLSKTEPESETTLPSEEDTEEEYVDSPSNFSKNKKIILVSLCSVALVLLIGIIFCVWYFLGGGPDDGLILNNVTVAGINIGGMTPEEATATIQRATGTTYTQQDMVIELADTTLILSPADTGAQLDVEAAVEAAYDYGRTGTRKDREAAMELSKTSNHTIALLPYLNLNTDYIRGVLEDYAGAFNSTYEASSYELEGDAPALDGEDFDADAPCQTLILNPGSPGRALDIEKLYNQVLDAYSFNEFRIDATDIAPETKPEALDLDAIYLDCYVAPIDAAMNMETFEVSYESYGYGFDLERAKEILAEADYGTSIGIPMEYVEPEFTKEELDGILFRDVLGAFESKHSSTANRTNNLKKACESINGIVLQPGEVFDYNEALGQRTAENGYLPAPAYSGGKTVQEYGGGICQVSSTLYYCALMGDLEIVSRTNHTFLVTYVPFGMDATVSWGGPEFRFCNNTEYPIRIEAEANESSVNIKILGTDTKDYYVEMEYVVVAMENPKEVIEYYPESNPNGYYDGQVIQTPYTGYTVRTYKYKYDKETGELISKEEDKRSVYKVRDQIIAKPEPVETEPTEDPTMPSIPSTPPSTGETTPSTPEETTPPSTGETTPPATEPSVTPPATEGSAEPPADTSGESSGETP